MRESGKQKKESPLQNKKGAALLIAIVIMMVMMVLGMALLLVSYSLFHTANKSQQTAQCEEMAVGVSQLIEKEITGEKYKTLAEMEAAINGETEAEIYPLWLYLRYNVFQTNWPYYNSEERGHSQKFAYRYFNINAANAVGEADTAGAELVGDTTIVMWWESENGMTDPNDIPLKVQVTCEVGEQTATVTTTYSLVASSWESETTGGENETEGQAETNDSEEDAPGNGGISDVNPTGNSIDTTGKYANWTWYFEERE